MTLERKLLIAAGALIVALIIAVGSFSLGLYTGQRGILPGPPAIAGPGGPGGPPGGAPDQPGPGGPGGAPGQPGPGNQPPGRGPEGPEPGARPANFPPGPPDLVGPLQAIDPAGLTINTPRGPRLVHLDVETEIFDAEGEPLSAEVLTIDAPLAIFGHFTDNGQAMVAETVVVLPPPP